MPWLPLIPDFLNDLLDVDIASPAEGDMIYRNDAGLWVVVGGTRTTGDAPIVQSDGSIAWDAPGSGGADGSVYHVADIPGSPDAWDDEFDDFDFSAYSWLNQNGAAAVEDNHMLTIYDDRNVNDISCLVRDAPSGNYTVETMLYPYVANATSTRSGGFLVAFYSTTVAGVGSFLSSDYRTLTWGSSGAGTATDGGGSTISPDHTGPLFMRIAWDGTDLSFQVSMSGQSESFVELQTIAPGSTPTDIGVGGIFNRGHNIGYSFEYLRRVA